MNENLISQQSFAAVLRSTPTVDFVLGGAHFIVVVPRHFLTSFDETGRKEPNVVNQRTDVVS